MIKQKPIFIEVEGMRLVIGTMKVWYLLDSCDRISSLQIDDIKINNKNEDWLIKY